MINEELLNELEVIMKEEFNVSLSRDEVIELANNLVGYFEVLVKNEYEKSKQI